MTTLARKLRLTEYFTLGFGVMVGVGWLIVMDDWLARGGPLGGVLGFAIGGVLLLPIGWVYGQWVMRLPDASGEVAYTAQVFPESVSFATGWMMLLAYFIVCPWEAVAVGKLAAYIFPQMDTMEVYRVAGQPVFLPRVAIGAAPSAAARRSASFVARSLHTTAGMLLARASLSTLRAGSICHHIYGKGHQGK